MNAAGVDLAFMAAIAGLSLMAAVVLGLMVYQAVRKYIGYSGRRPGGRGL